MSQYAGGGSVACLALTAVHSSVAQGGTAISLALLTQFSSTLVPESGQDGITPQGSDAQNTQLVHAQS